VLRKIVAASAKFWDRTATDNITKAMTSFRPYRLGFPSDRAQSNYYLGAGIRRNEIANVTRVMEVHGIEEENTRIRKFVDQHGVIFEVLQASVETGVYQLHDSDGDPRVEIRIVEGDHGKELSKICAQYV
jgi:dipeptidyl-peptidase-3